MVDGVVLDVQLRQTKLFRQTRGTHQRSEPRVEAGARLLHRKQFEIAPERSRPRLNQLTRHYLANGVVVEFDLERAHALAAHVGSGERILGPALVTGQPDDETHISLTMPNAEGSMPNAQCPMLNAGAGVMWWTLNVRIVASTPPRA